MSVAANLRIAALALLTACALGAGAAQAATYGGGRLPLTSKHYDPHVSATVRTDGARVGIRFETTLKCGRATYAKIVGLSGGALRRGRARLHGRSRIFLGPGVLRYRWRINLRAGPRRAKGVLVIRGRRTKGRHRTCDAHPRRPIAVLRARRLTGPGAPARPGGVYRGLSASKVQGRYRGAVVLHVTRDGRRVEAGWEAAARCGRGPREVFPNHTPLRRIGRGNGFVSRERFRVHYSDAVGHYRIVFRGRFRKGGVAGTLRLRVRLRWTSRPRYTTHCDSGKRRWSAGLG